MDKLKTKEFWTDLAERCISTFAETFLGFIVVEGVSGLETIEWIPALSVSAVATLASVLKAFIKATKKEEE